MVSNNYRRDCADSAGMAESFELLLSVLPEGNMFESVVTRGYVLRIFESRVLADAAMAVARGPVS